MSHRSLGLLRREVLLAGELLPDPFKQPGKHHGIIIRVAKQEKSVTVQMSDIVVGKTKMGGRRQLLVLDLSADSIVPYLLPRAKKERPVPEERPAWADRPAKKQKATLPALLHGAALLERMSALQRQGCSTKYPPGTRLWVRVPGSCSWPGVAWAWDLCKRKDQGELLRSHKDGQVLVRFYGQHSSAWLCESHCLLPAALADESELVRQLKAHSRAHQHLQLVELALCEMQGALPDAEEEKARMLQLEDAHLRQRSSSSSTCYLCGELGASLLCTHCERTFHPICLRSPAVSIADLPDGQWACPSCGEAQHVSEKQEGQEEAEQGERMGLTPDWVITAACQVFGLQMPTPSQPYIAGLLDPCTNSKLAPNIPAEKLYSKEDDGLLLKNSWEGFYVLLNPDFSAQTAWRFVNRAVDEVESGQCPGIILISRNSTDTSYWARLHCFPRVLLRRTAVQFKDYNKSAIGFGICVICIFKFDVDDPKPAQEVFKRFHDAFASHGEANIPVDRQLLESRAFYSLLGRLRQHASQHYRDHWVQCSQCERWRLVDYAVAQGLAEDALWTCSMLSPPHTSCSTPLSRRELIGGHYAAHEADWGGQGASSAPASNMPIPAQQQQHSDTGSEALPEVDDRDVPEAKQDAKSAHGQQEQVLASAVQLVGNQAVQQLTQPPAASIGLPGQEGQVLTALELARAARVAANRAYLKTLGLGSQAMRGGQVPDLPPTDAAVLSAARELARQAATEQARLQLEHMQQQYEMARRRGQREEAAVLQQLAAVRQDEERAQQQLQLAEAAVAQMQNDAGPGGQGL